MVAKKSREKQVYWKEMLDRQAVSDPVGHKKESLTGAETPAEFLLAREPKL